MSHKQGKLSPNTPKTNANVDNRNTGLDAVEYEEAMEVEQPLSDTSEHDPSSDVSQDEQQPWLYTAPKGCCGNPCEQTDASVDVYDENDEARASGVIEAVFENILRHKVGLFQLVRVACVIFSLEFWYTI
ncbi:unnamed protein product [Trichobilharzia regenti]|nr:unnamed protein product [Trichobilharzia regenti]